MRISDWSSDVCSSDLAGPGFSRTANDLQTDVDQYRIAGEIEAGNHRIKIGAEWNHADVFNLFVQNATGQLVFQNVDDLREGILSNGTSTFTNPQTVVDGDAVGAFGQFSATGANRSEEHTSELQSLMRISYAVFGLK